MKLAFVYVLGILTAVAVQLAYKYRAAIWAWIKAKIGPKAEA